MFFYFGSWLEGIQSIIKGKGLRQGCEVADDHVAFVLGQQKEMDVGLYWHFLVQSMASAL